VAPKAGGGAAGGRGARGRARAVRRAPALGKLFLAGAETVAPLYARAGDFAALVERLDPRGAFRNTWLERHVLGA
jgi:hypothetical protein